jgi:hypothetical protein
VQLPEDFPHTRHEQYVVALPASLLTRAEVCEALGISERLHRYLDGEITRLVAVLLALDSADASSAQLDGVSTAATG